MQTFIVPTRQIHTLQETLSLYYCSHTSSVSHQILQPSYRHPQAWQPIQSHHPSQEQLGAIKSSPWLWL